jgi:hypothetical protein
MAQKKICDKCKAPTSNTFSSECEFCGGTSFSYIQNAESDPTESFIGPNRERYSNKADNYNSSIFDGLIDTSFLKYSTQKLASFAYKVALFFVGIVIFASAIFLLWVIGNENTTFPLFLLAILLITITFLITLIWLALLRLKLESFTVLVQIAKNTHSSEDQV